MDPERYAKVRELFLAVDELPSQQQKEKLHSLAGDDQELIAEVMSLLDEHDIDLAIQEGESAKAPAFPSTSQIDEVVNQSQADGSSSLSVEDASVSDDDSTRSVMHSPTVDAAPFMPGAQAGLDTNQDSGDRSTPSKRRRKRSRATGDQTSTRRPNSRAAEVTQHSSQRTHASPRYQDDSDRQRTTAVSNIWQARARRHRRFNSGWLWLAALLPTAMIGVWTYYKVAGTLEQAVRNELVGVADNVQSSVNRFLHGQSKLVESWSRQMDLRNAVEALVELAKKDPPKETLLQSDHAQTIRDRLVTMSEIPEIKYVVWDRSGTIIASWLEDGADLGGTVAPDGAANLARALRGDTVLFGPEILVKDDTGFRPETEFPVMAKIVPVRAADGRIIATLLIRGMGLFEEFDNIFQHASTGGGLDVYAVNREGQMVSNSPHATTLLTQSVLDLGSDFVACHLRVSDPGTVLERGEEAAVSRKSQPLTYSVAGASNGNAGVRLDEYRNYAGEEVVGAWRWVDDWGIGVVVERTNQSAFAAAGVVRLGFILLAFLLTLTAFFAASRIAQRTALAQAAVHPLSRYELESELGSGGMGVVYRAKHSQLGRETALKVLRSDRDHVEDRLRFDREARMAASLSSPHTVTIYDYGRSDEDEAYCVMEFLRGITLYDVVARSGFQDFGRTLFILRQICDSLGEAHQLGLVHRDVKPQNVMLSLDPSVGDWAVVFDFGLAKPLKPDANAYQTAETVWAGTPMYMAPERYREPNKIDPRSDIYSVGCIAYFLLSGRPPFIECDPESLFALVLTEEPISIGVHRDQEVPSVLVGMVKKCMAKGVKERYQSVEELAADLDQLIKQYPWTVDEARSWWAIHGAEIT